MDFLSLFKSFLIESGKVSKVTLKNYLSDIRFFIFWYERFYSQPFSPTSIDYSVVQAFKNYHFDRIAFSSLDRKLSALRKFFSFLKEKGFIASVPFQEKSKEAEDKFSLKEFKNFLFRQNISSVSSKNYLIDITQFLNWADQVIKPSEHWIVSQRDLYSRIDNELVNEYKRRLIDQGFSPLSVNRKLSSIRKLIFWAIKEGKIKKNRFDFIKEKGLFPLSTKGSTLTIQGGFADFLTPKIEEKAMTYSKIPPIRVAQKILVLFSSIYDDLIIDPIAEFISFLNLLLFRFDRKSIFKSDIKKIPRIQDPIKISNVGKNFYAPLNISTKGMSWIRKISYSIRFIRPKWYLRYHNYAVVHYIHFSILVIFMTVLGFGIYQKFFLPTTNVLGESIFSLSRILTVKQRLTDSLGNPITEKTLIRFAIYGDPEASGSAMLWEDVKTVEPDENGFFQTSLGEKTPIPSSIFFTYPSLWLGTSIGQTSELRPRQQLTNVSLATSAQTLKGLGINSPLNYKNVILSLDSSGNLSLGGPSHIFQAINGQFVLSGNILTLSTISGTNTNIEIVPDGLGKVDIQKPIQNTSNNNNIPTAIGSVEIDDLVSILATSSGQSALTINQNDLGPIISASASGIAKFTIDSFGNMTLSGDISLSGNNVNVFATSPQSTLSIGSEDGGNLILQPVSTGEIQFFSPLNFLSSEGTLKLSGNLILSGTSSPSSSFRLYVEDSQPSTAAAQIFNTSAGSKASGLLIKLGNTSGTTNTDNKWVTFEQSGIGIVGMIKGNGEKGVTFQGNGVSDFAEYLKKDENENIPFGSLVCIDEKGMVTGCSYNNRNIVGVASENPTFLGGENLGNKSIPVGLVGQVPVFVSNINGDIKPGDPLTSSFIKGLAAKAKDEGRIVGRALESFDSLNCINESSNFGLVEKRICKGKIQTLLNVSHYEPSPLDQAQKIKELVLQEVDNGIFEIKDSLGIAVEEIQAFNKSIIGTLEAGIINARRISVETLNLNALFIEGESLKDYIAQIIQNQPQIKSPIAEIDEIKTNIISPLSQEKDIKIKIGETSNLAVENLKGQTVFNVDSEGNATLAGELSTSSLKTNEIKSDNATVSGVLHAKKIVTDEIENQSENNSVFANIASFSSQLVYVQNLKAQTANFTDGLIALGPSSLIDTAISGQLSINSNLILAENSINVLGSDLEIQSVRQGGVSLMGGFVYIDTDGNLKVGGNAEFAKDITVKGIIFANIISPIPDSDLIVDINAENKSFIIKNKDNPVVSVTGDGNLTASGSGTFGKLNLSLIKPALAVSETEAVATGAAGVATISAYQKELTIKNSLITKDSLIYVTPRTDTKNIVIYLLRQVPGISFTVGVNTPSGYNIPFNFLIIN